MLRNRAIHYAYPCPRPKASLFPFGIEHKASRITRSKLVGIMNNNDKPQVQSINRMLTTRSPIPRLSMRIAKRHLE
jgi:hypothetical protein